MVQEPNKLSEDVKRAEGAQKSETQELISERIDERQEKPLPEQQVEPPTPVLPPSPAPGVGALVGASKDADLAAIESILSDGLGELYGGMNSRAQEKFRVRGEETASKIQQLITRAKVQARKVAALIRGWLAMIPGVSYFFLEQETKIKTDRIMEYSEKRKGE